MKRILLLLILAISYQYLIGNDRVATLTKLPGIDQPIDFCIRRDGLSMIVIERTKKGELYWEMSRSSLEYEWTSKKEFRFFSESELVEGLMIRSPFYSYDDCRIYFSANLKSSKGGLDIYYLEKTVSGWSEPIQLNSEVNTEDDEYSPSLSGDGRHFYFLREISMPKLKKFKTGALYHQAMNRNDRWETPELVTEQINQNGIRYAKVYPDNLTLLYSDIVDDRTGWEIKWTKRLGTRHWFLPSNIQASNDKDSEIAPNYCEGDGNLYFIDGKLKDFSQSYQMMSIHMPKSFVPQQTFYFTGILRNKADGLPIEGAEIVMFDKNSIDIKGRIYTDDKGRWELRLLAGASYMFHVEKDDFTEVYELMSESETQKDLNLDLQISPTVELLVNTFDTEDFRPMKSTLEVLVNGESQQNLFASQRIPGQYSLILPVGVNYQIAGHCKDYFSDTIELALNHEVLYDEFERDIQLDYLTRDVEIKLFDQEKDSILTGEIEFIDTMRDQHFMPISPNKNGLYELTLREGQYYNVEASGTKGYSFFSGSFDMDLLRNVQLYKISLDPLNMKVAIKLDNIYFEYNSAALLQESFAELNRVVKLLNDNPEITLEISAHTDDVGTDEYNLRLSQKRAQSVVNYLEENQIDYRRLVPIGYGESLPLVENNDDAHRRMNRRVEMRLSDKVIVEKNI